MRNKRVWKKEALAKKSIFGEAFLCDVRLPDQIF